MNGIGDFVASIKETQRLVAQIAIEIKGEAEGHPFRGNQWGAGSGGGSIGNEGGELLPESEQGKILKSKREQTVSELSSLRAEHDKAEIRPAHRSADNKELSEVHDRMLTQIHNTKGTPEEETWRKRLESVNAEKQFRTREALLNRRLTAIDEGIKTGKLTVSESEMAHLINSQGDAYIDAGWNGRGKPAYNPEAFHKSDLSGKPIRHYVTLPDGRKAHPDELVLSRKRGRVVVVPNTV